MINHARNLLMNVSAITGIDTIVGEQVVDPLYTPKNFSTPVQAARRLLFGKTPDRVMLNFRCHQILSMLHATELAEFITALDPRVTYLDNAADLYADVKLASIIAPYPLAVIGEMGPPDVEGYTRISWAITLDAAAENATVLNRTTKKTAVYAVDDENGLSSPIPLVGSALSVRTPIIPDGQWRVTINNLPQYDLAYLWRQARLLPESVIIALFRLDKPVGKTEPYQTFYNLWRQHPELAYNFGGFLLALIYKMNEE